MGSEIAAPAQTEALSTPPIAIFTPAYNRAYIIGELYKSLCSQTCQDFVWIVVDDGSTDNTREVIEGFAAEGKIPITYVYQENGGKARAHNRGVDLCQNELFFCVDSDDTLTPDAVSSVLDFWAQRKTDPTCAGIVALRGHDSRKPLGTWFPEELETTTLWDLYYKQGHKGDVALVYRTEILRQFPFEVEPGEKFIAEPSVYHQIDQEYNLAVLHKVIWICEYLPDGYTQNVRKITRENPRGYLRTKRQYIDYSDTFRLKLENTTLCLVGAYFAHCFGETFRSLPSKGAGVIAAPLAWVLCHTVYRGN